MEQQTGLDEVVEGASESLLQSEARDSPSTSVLSFLHDESWVSAAINNIPLPNHDNEDYEEEDTTAGAQVPRRPIEQPSVRPVDLPEHVNRMQQIYFKGRENTRNEEPAMRQPIDISFFDFISSLRPILPGMDVQLPQKWRHQNSGRTFIVNIASEKSVPVRVIRVRHDKHLNEALAIYANRNENGVKMRLFLVEDLCPSAIETLWKHFNRLSPEVFISHLRFSGYDGNAGCGLVRPETFVVGFTRAPSFHTVRWVRSGQCLPHIHALKREEDIWTLPYRHEELSHIPPEERFMRRDGTYVDNTFDYAKTVSNILRNCETFPIEENEDTEGAVVRCVWEESATILVMEDDYQQCSQSQCDMCGRVSFPVYTDSKLALIFVDPLPVVAMSQCRSPLSKNVLPYEPAKRQRNRGPRTAHFQGRDIGYVRDVASRARKVHSTAEDVIRCLQNNENHLQQIDKCDVIEWLTVVIATDIIVALQMFLGILEDISKLSLNDGHLQTHIKVWREKIHFIESTTPILKKNFRVFAESYTERGVKLPAPVVDVEESANLVMTRLRQLNKNLRADMSIIESRRGIEEAESVTRLTELAFIFIPLTFVSSLFSMQVEELKNGVPLWIFFLTAAVASTFLYCLRIFIRSRTFAGVKKSIVGRTRKRNKIPHPLPIPFFVFLKDFCMFPVRILRDTIVIAIFPREMKDPRNYTFPVLFLYKFGKGSVHCFRKIWAKWKGRPDPDRNPVPDTDRSETTLDELQRPNEDNHMDV
jgi:hypothetical protein